MAVDAAIEEFNVTGAISLSLSMPPPGGKEFNVSEALWTAFGPYVSLDEESRGHKLDVCTRPRSRWKQSRTAAPTELRRATIEFTIDHLLSRMS